jgi:biopolymer transport protein ExbD
MALRKLRVRTVEGESTFELNLAPMLDMFVSIIPFMLLSAVFMQLALIDSPLPAVIEKALAEDRSKTQREVTLRVKAETNRTLVLEVTDEKGHLNRSSFNAVAGEFDLNGLHGKLVEAKLKYPKIFRLELLPAEGVEYDGIVKLMDAARSTYAKDPKPVIDGVETTLLFPDAILANVMGGE